MVDRPVRAAARPGHRGRGGRASRRGGEQSELDRARTRWRSILRDRVRWRDRRARHPVVARRQRSCDRADLAGARTCMAILAVEAASTPGKRRSRPSAPPGWRF